MRDAHTFFLEHLKRAAFMLDRIDPHLGALAAKMDGDDLAIAFDVHVEGWTPPGVAMVTHDAAPYGLLDQIEGASPLWVRGFSSLWQG